MSLHARIRPGVEAAPWVCDEVKKLEQRVVELERAAAKDVGEGWREALLQVAVVLEALRSSDSAERLANMDGGKVLGEAYQKLRHIRSQAKQLTAIPKGWKAVPEEPTSEMTWAAVKAGGWCMADLVKWRAILAAVPSLPDTTTHQSKETRDESGL